MLQKAHKFRGSAHVVLSSRRKKVTKKCVILDNFIFTLDLTREDNKSRGHHHPGLVFGRCSAHQLTNGERVVVAEGWGERKDGTNVGELASDSDALR